MIVIDFFGYPGAGKSTLMSMIDDPDIVKWIDLPPLRRLDIVKHLFASSFFWKNLILMLRVSWISGFHGTRQRNQSLLKGLKGKMKNLEVILHFIYNAERFSGKYKIYIVEKGPVSTLPVRSGVRGYRTVERFLDRLVEIYPYSILYFYSDTPSLMRNMRRRMTEKDRGVLNSAHPERRIRKRIKDMERGIEKAEDKLMHVAYIKTDERDLDANLKKVQKELQKIKKKAGV
ncbi:MAG: hypothetical protein ACLFNK_04940 [Candidatus Woesearchaeota archaeon]